MSNPFPTGATRPWTRITNAAKAISTLVLGRGELAITETGKVVAGNGTNVLSELSPLLTEAGAFSTYVTYDGATLRLNGTGFSLPAGTVIIDNGDGTLSTGTNSGSGLAPVDNGDGSFTLSGAGAADNTDGTFTATGSPVTDNGDGTYTLVA